QLLSCRNNFPNRAVSPRSQQGQGRVKHTVKESFHFDRDYVERARARAERDRPDDLSIRSLANPRDGRECIEIGPQPGGIELEETFLGESFEAVGDDEIGDVILNVAATVPLIDRNLASQDRLPDDFKELSRIDRSRFTPGDVEVIQPT